MEFPDIYSLYQDFQDSRDAAVLTVHKGSNEITVFRYFKEVDMEVPVLMDFDGKFSEEMVQGNLPTTLILDKQGRLIVRIKGFTDKNMILEGLLKARSLSP